MEGKENLIGGTAHVSGKLINTAYMAYRQFMQQKFKEHGLDLTIEMVQVLRHLWIKDGVNQQEIANAVEKDKTSLTYLIDNLSRRNLVERKEDPKDRRNKIIFLTEEGVMLKDKMMVLANEMLEVSSRDITETKLHEVNQVLEKIIFNLKGEQK